MPRRRLLRIGWVFVDFEEPQRWRFEKPMNVETAAHRMSQIWQSTVRMRLLYTERCPAVQGTAISSWVKECRLEPAPVCMAAVDMQ